jgi:hypothetical protein
MRYFSRDFEEEVVLHVADSIPADGVLAAADSGGHGGQTVQKMTRERR